MDYPYKCPYCNSRWSAAEFVYEHICYDHLGDGMKSYYLWSGTGAIEDLEDCTSCDEAVKELKFKTAGDWTLWQRDGMNVRLVAIYIPGLREHRLHGLAGGHLEEFVFDES